MQTKQTVPPDPDTRRAALVARVSSDRQDSERQIHTVRQLAAEHYADLTTEEHFADGGVSATKTPIFDRLPELVESIERGEIAVVIADEQSRLVRGTTSGEWATFYDLCREAGTILHTAAEGIITDDDASELVGSIRAWASRREISHLRRRVREEKAKQARAGQWPHGAVPQAYVRDPETKRLVPTHDAPAILAAFQTVGHRIPKEKARRQLEARLGRKIARRTFELRILRNRAYLGLVPWDGKEHPGHEPVVPEELFDRVQRILDESADSRDLTPRLHPFTGLLRCLDCREPLRYQALRKNPRYSYHYFRCDRDDCDAQRISAATVDAHFAAGLGLVALELRVLLDADPDYGRPAHTATLPDVELALAAAEFDLRELAQLVKDRAISTADPDYQRALARRNGLAEQCDQLLSVARTEREELEALAAHVEAVAGEDGDTTMERTFTGWPTAGRDDRRQLIEEHVEMIVPLPTGLAIHFRALPQPVILPWLFSGPKTSAATRELESFGFGIFEKGDPFYASTSATAVLHGSALVVHEPLEEVALPGRGGVPDVLQHLVGGEVLAAPDQGQALLQLRLRP